MAETKKTTKPKNSLVGKQAVPTTLDNTTKLDIDVKNTLIDNIVAAGLTGGLDTTALENFTSISNSRDQIYQLIDTMSQDSTVSSIIRTYAEDVCAVADNDELSASLIVPEFSRFPTVISPLFSNTFEEAIFKLD